MSIKRRLALLLGLLLIGLLAALVVGRRMERSELEQTLAMERRNRTQRLSHWIDIATADVPQFAGDTAQSEEFSRLLAAPDAVTARTSIETQLDAAEMNALWVVRADGTARVAYFGSPRDRPAHLPMDRAELAQLIADTPNPHFFATDGPDLLELSVRRLSTGQDRLVVARRWDASRLSALAGLIDARVSLTAPDDAAAAPVASTEIILLRPLVDWRGHPVRTLRIDYHAPEIGRANETDWHQIEILVAYGLLLVSAVGLALQNWVLRPLRRIGMSLATNDSASVLELSREKNEFGEVARLVRTSFEQRDALQREFDERARAHAALERTEAALRRNIEERARLGRDLHDGVIQSLYATGMGLAGIRDLLHSDQGEAALRLEQTRSALNETIHDVRNFIIGLEPEALKLQTFSQAVSALLESLHSVRKFDSQVRIDEALAARLTLAQRVHALQITREAVSNALRHGEANHIAVSLRPVAEFAEFEVTDDGRGFEPRMSPSDGGLRNFAQRAQELGAQLTVDSKPGQGTRVRLVFSLNLYA